MTPPYSIQELQTALSALPLPNPAFLATFLVGLLTCQTARFGKIATSMPGDAQPKSQQMRLRRYLDRPGLDFSDAIATLLPEKAPWVLAIDRTNWKKGGRDVNLLVLAVIVGKTAVPLFWQDLSHPGNSDTPQRIALMEQFIARFGTQSIRFVTADREFIGEDWLAWLAQRDIAFVIRIRKTDILTHSDGTAAEAAWFFERRADSCRNKKVPWHLWGTAVHVGGKRLPAEQSKTNAEDWLILVSNRSGWDLWKLYRHRWGIETLFQAFKGRGFDIERCDSPRLSRFVGLLALGFLWSLRAGMHLDEVAPRKLLKHGRPEESWFRRGVDYLHRLLAPLAGCARRATFDHALSLLQPPKTTANNFL